MKELPPGLAASLASGVTTLARCWRITRRDGIVIGVTEHDRDLTVDATSFHATAGVGGSENPSTLGFAANAGELTGALTADQLLEGDLAAGLYDGAGVELLLADWSSPADFIRLRRARIGEVRRENGVFVAELRGLADALGQVRGRLFTTRCDADLGDGRCGVKHVTHNEALLLLDAAVQLAVTDRTHATPPGAPLAGDRYLVAAGASGEWAGQAGAIALYDGAGWRFLAPRAGWRAYAIAEGRALGFDGTRWTDALAATASGGGVGLKAVEADVDLASGAAVVSTLSIPDRAICLGVASRTVLRGKQDGGIHVSLNGKDS